MDYGVVTQTMWPNGLYCVLCGDKIPIGGSVFWWLDCAYCKVCHYEEF